MKIKPSKFRMIEKSANIQYEKLKKDVTLTRKLGLDIAERDKRNTLLNLVSTMKDLKKGYI